MEVVQPGLEVHNHSSSPPPPQSGYSHHSSTTPTLQHLKHSQPYYDNQYQKHPPQSETLYDGGMGSAGIPPAPHSQYFPDSEPSRVMKARRKNWVPPAITAVIVAVLVGAAVGGGLGASLKSCESNLSRAESQLGTVSAASTKGAAAPTGMTGGVPSAPQATNEAGLAIDYRPLSPDKVAGLSDKCNDYTSTVEASSYRDTYTTICDVDITSGNKTTDSGGTVWVGDILGLVSYSYRDCMNACSSYSHFQEEAGNPARCKAVTFRPSLAHAYQAYSSANCWLKNGTASKSSYPECQGCISGQL